MHIIYYLRKLLLLNFYIYAKSNVIILMEYILKIFIPSLFFLLLSSCLKCPVPFSYDLADQFTVSQHSDAIALDSDRGYIYVADSWDNQIFQYTLQGNQVQTLVDFTQDNIGNYDFYNVIDLVVDDNSNIYILVKPWTQNLGGNKNFLNGFCIIKYNCDGEYQKEFDFTKLDEDWYSWNLNLAYKNNVLYVTNGIKLKKINSEDGQSSDHIFEIPNLNFYDPNFFHIADFAIDDKNNIWVVGQASWNAGINSVPEDWKVGAHITKFGSDCKNPETFYAKSKTSFFGSNLNRPGICFDSDNNMYLATCYGQSIEIYDFDQEFQREIKIEGERSIPTDIAIDNNNLYVLDGYNDQILIYRLDS